MKFSISIAMSEANHYVPLAQAAERIGYHAIVLPDSIFFSEEVSAPVPLHHRRQAHVGGRDARGSTPSWGRPPWLAPPRASSSTRAW
jgi:hypothetical protein